MLNDITALWQRANNYIDTADIEQEDRRSSKVREMIAKLEGAMDDLAMAIGWDAAAMALNAK